MRTTRGVATTQRLLVIAGAVLFVAGLTVLTGLPALVTPGGQSESNPADAGMPPPPEPSDGAEGGADPPAPTPGVGSGATSPDSPDDGRTTPDPTPTEDSGITIDLPL